MVDQAWLKSIVQQRNTHKRSLRPLKVSSKQWSCLLLICAKNFVWIQWIIGLVLLTTTIELMLPMVLRVFRSFQWYAYDLHILLLIGVVVLLIAGIYIAIQYKILVLGQSVVLYVINTLREHMFVEELKRNPMSVKHTDKGRFLAGISYHLSLLQQSMQQLFPKGIVWIGYVIGMTVLSAVLGLKFLMVQIMILLVSAGLIWLGYVLSSRYVSQHQTMYSAMLRFVSESLDERQWVWTAQLQSQLQQTLRSIVAVDTHFRIKRTVWTRLGPTIIIVFLSAMLFMIAIFLRQSDIVAIAHPVTLMMWGFLTAFGIRLCLLSYQIGFAWFILELGMVLVVPEQLHAPIRVKKCLFTSLRFSSKKVKFSRQSSYTKSCSLTVKSGDNIRIVSDYMPVLHDIMRLFLGYLHAGEMKPWVIKRDGNHISYNVYRQQVSVMQVRLDMHTEKTYAEWFVTKKRSLKQVVEQLQSFPELSQYLPKLDLLSQSLHLRTTTPEDAIVLQCIAICMHIPQMVVIDPLVLQSQLPCVAAFIQYLRQEHPEMIQVHISLSHTDLPYPYDKILKI